jgi:hypothetical protein
MENKRKKIQEAPIDYGDGPERMSRSIEDKLRRGETIFKGNPAIPSEKSSFTDPMGREKESSSLEKMAADRFNEIVTKVRDITGLTDLTRQDMIQYLMQNMMEAYSQSASIESRHKAELEQLAIASVLEEKNIPEGAFEIDAKIVSPGAIDTSKMRKGPEDDEEEEENNPMDFPNFDVSDLTDDEIFQLEKHKRTIINALIQGSAKRDHYLFEKPSVSSALNRINGSLVPLYKRIMSINDLFYWTQDEMITRMSQTGMGVAGSVELDDNDDGGDDSADTKIIARGANFPILTHELSKGFEEAFGRAGLPKDPMMAQKVMGQTDLLPSEPDQLRIGPTMIKKLRFALPDELFDPESGDLMNWFKMSLYSMDADEFLKIMKKVLSDDPTTQDLAKRDLGRILDSAKQAKRKFEEGDDDDDDDYGDDDGFPSDDDGFEGLDDFLGGLGIDKPKD